LPKSSKRQGGGSNNSRAILRSRRPGSPAPALAVRPVADDNGGLGAPLVPPARSEDATLPTTTRIQILNLH
jgi:hypothetical protein